MKAKIKKQTKEGFFVTTYHPLKLLISLTPDFSRGDWLKILSGFNPENNTYILG